MVNPTEFEQSVKPSISVTDLRIALNKITKEKLDDLPKVESMDMNSFFSSAALSAEAT